LKISLEVTPGFHWDLREVILSFCNAVLPEKTQIVPMRWLSAHHFVFPFLRWLQGVTSI